MNSKSFEVKRHFIKDKIIIGIDPAKKKHLRRSPSDKLLFLILPVYQSVTLSSFQTTSKASITICGR